MSILLEPEENDIFDNDELIVGRLETPSEPDGFSYDVVIYLDRIFAITRASGLRWAADYFTMKIMGCKTCEDVRVHCEFSITTHTPPSKLTFYKSNNTHTNEEQNYKHYQTHAEVIDESTVYERHRELLKAAIIRKLLDAPARDQILRREEEHRAILRQEINRSLTELGPALYGIANMAVQNCLMKFEHISELRITDYKKLPRFAKYPCGDGKIRESFNDYVYYLCEQLFPRNDDETDPQLWLGARLQEKLKAALPHLSIQAQTQPLGIFPKIVIDMNIDVSNALH